MGSTEADNNSEDSPRSKLEKIVDSLTSSITKKMETLPDESYTVCIYRISEKHRKINEEAYTPRLVSIGPLHHGKSQLQAMESYKLRCLRSFMFRFEIGIEKLINFAAKVEMSVRGCYEDTIDFSPRDFSEIILLDGVFIVDLFLKNQFKRQREQSDVMFENKWMSSDILHDLLLLENQLPIGFLAKLFDFVDGSSVSYMSFHDLALCYFKDKEVGNTHGLKLTDYCKRARHLVEFLVNLHQPSHQIQGAARFGKFEYTRSASELQQAGLEFRAGVGNCIFDVDFSAADGVLRIPQLKVNDSSETFFRNLIAFEQCGHYSTNITSYIIFMDSLINTHEDVDLLVKSNIIENLLGESQQVADLFNNLYKEVVPEQSQFYFAEICDDLNKYSKDYLHELKSRWFKWKVILGRDYFSNPWSIISLIAAFILLVLTIVQTVCSLISVI